MSAPQPLVDIVTPVYNGGRYLRECIESVVGQRYANWRYLIVNNCSTDDTLAIAREYAQRDSRIRIYDNADFLPIVENHNRAIALIDDECTYCKPLMADDRLFPECLEAMVACAQRQDSIGLVCSLAVTSDQRVLYDELRPAGEPATTPVTVLAGRDACRIPLLHGRHFFGSPTTMLVRADLVRKRRPFYDPLNVHADSQSCYDILRESDFGFVHRPLAYVREHDQSQTARMLGLESMRAGRFYTFSRFGRAYLSEAEFRQCYRSWRTRYYAMLAGAAVELRGREFWDFHRRMLGHSGAPLNYTRLTFATASHIAQRLTSPRSLRSFARRMGGAVRRLWHPTAT